MSRSRMLRRAGIVAAAGVLCLSGGLFSSRILARGTVGLRPAPPAVRFVDVTAASEITFRYERRPGNIRHSVGSGVALWDYDGDGRLDIYLVGQKAATYTGGGMLFRNRGDGTFQDVTAASGLGLPGAWVGCAVGDVDDDGRTDLLLTGYGDCRLFRNLGAGRFRDITAASGLRAPSPHAWASSASFADVNRDGMLDVMVGRYLHFKKPGSAQEAAEVTKWWSPASFPAQRGSLYLGVGGGRFRDATVQFGLARSTGKTLGVAFSDVNGDGFQDLYLANDGVACDLYLNEQGARFVNRGLASGTAYNYNGGLQAGMGADWGDCNSDGRFDLFVTNYEREPFSLYENDGHGFFTHASFRAGIGEPSMPYIGWGTKFLDYDRDGWLDLVCVNGHVRSDAAQTGGAAPFEQPLLLFRGAGGGQFQLVSGPGGVDLGPPMAARGLAVGDIDNDGDPDLLIGSMSGSPRLLRNDTVSLNRWVGLELRGREGNRMAIGARVTVAAAGRRLVREVTTGGSYLSASDPRLLFGLGTAPRPDYVEIVWPDGTMQRVADVMPGRYHTYVEPETFPTRR